MAFSLRMFFLLCGISGLLSGTWSWPRKDNECCPKGWTQLDDHCYVFKDDERTFADAESVCNILGGNLASVTSALKNVVVYQLITEGEASDAWIGLNDAIEDGEYFWTDGKVFDFENFVSMRNDTGNCAVMVSKGEWDDAMCTNLEPYVCIREVYSYCGKH
ncbi:galactose-specific lectin nattectin-like [Dunckerocampus dactyliophorus]|uniref:galactose-specific lectin nattectin-like n=1 Tax=Dunckerocampus dactyliophorus TaxID=161453 RepID=UPI002405A9FA|nr:galactose-specific lectin nattectin-like [Dunckerocampus dactyliophorus]